jgi:hypothetical protein
MTSLIPSSCACVGCCLRRLLSKLLPAGRNSLLLPVPVSAAAACTAGDLVHTVFGASKDFCGSGLRVGVLYSKNAALNTALGNLGYFASVPAPLQMSLSKLLADDSWLDGYLKENRARMLEAYIQLAGGSGVLWCAVLRCAVAVRCECGLSSAAKVSQIATPAPRTVTSAVEMFAQPTTTHLLCVPLQTCCSCYVCGIPTGALDAAGIPYTPSPAGMFTWLDLRAAFSSGDGSGDSNGSNGSSTATPPAAASSSSGSWQDEADLWQHMLDVHKLVLTPGGEVFSSAAAFWACLNTSFTGTGRLNDRVDKIAPRLQYAHRCDAAATVLCVHVRFLQALHAMLLSQGSSACAGPGHTLAASSQQCSGCKQQSRSSSNAMCSTQRT